jgi:nitrite reductase/ring-hydroxylating ferredoxin subunit
MRSPVRTFSLLAFPLLLAVMPAYAQTDAPTIALEGTPNDVSGTIYILRGFTAFAQAKSRGVTRILRALGYGLMTTAAHLGGEVIYTHRVGVDRTAGQTFPADFVSVLAESELAESQPKRAEHDGIPILLVRRGTHIFALAETCSHFSGPLSEGKLIGDSIQCSWHGSRFALEDGRVLDGPAVHPQPRLEIRVRSGQIEVRQSPIGKTLDA